MSGHQPEFFHPGVWFKNFALAQIAKQSGAIGVNMGVDNDLCRSPSIRCPSESNGEFRVESVAYDSSGSQPDDFQPGAVPYEARQIQDVDLFRSFGERIEERIGRWVDEPLIATLWPFAIEAQLASNNLGAAITTARAKLERSLGIANLELTVGQLSDTVPFRRFLLHLASKAEPFAESHNQALEAYRRVNRIRSRSHPAPALKEAGGWIETPFWIWTSESPVRNRAFVRSEKNMRFGAPGQIELELPNPVAQPKEALAVLAHAFEQGVRIRPRALTTTMYARLFVCDLFLHGVGGAKYDQLTDELIRRFWGVRPRAFATMTATALLPIPLHGVGSNSMADLHRLRREYGFHAERHIEAPLEDAQRLIDEKASLVRMNPKRGAGKARQERLLEINRQLSRFLSDKHEQQRHQRAELSAQMRHDQLFGSREFSFCLHSWKTLPQLLLDLCLKQP